MRPRLAGARLLVPFLVGLALSLAAPVVAGTSEPGVNLRWDNCYGDGGAWNKAFACDSNVLGEQLVGSIELDQTITRVNSIQFVVDIVAASPALPAWWSLARSGGCRSTSLDLDPFQYPPSSACVPWAAGPYGGGLGTYSAGPQGPASARVTGAVAVSIDHLGTLSPGTEYFVFRLTIDHAKTVGTGACAGCNEPVCIFLSRVSLFQQGQSMAAIHLERGANFLGSQYVTWQNGYPIDVHHECDPSVPFCARQYTAFGCVLAGPTSGRRSTWGAVKSLYR